MITILIPIYNGIEFISESVQSVQAQTYSDWQLLIGVNGYSGEESDVYLKASFYASAKIQVYNMETVGKSNTLNALLERASEIVCLLDVDDIWSPTKLEKQIPWMEQYDVVGSGCQYFGTRRDSPAIPYGEIDPQVFMRVNPIINSSAMFRADIAYWDAEWEGIEDYEMWLRLNHEGKKFYNLDEKLVYHRIHEASAFNTRHFDVKGIVNKWRV